ncbi:PREDICTED: brevican core protein [Calidris pugnax]|uniref:brevican core protein n=1 Tax=Calidris pugnax TaxID=198806 RepID=UPI00071D2743|nr:PREDICTED: brevican core protein [Calidris pugnax]
MASALPLLLLWAFAPTVVPEVFAPADGTEDLKALQVSIPRQPALDPVLAGDITIPCLITYLGPQPTPGTPGRRAVLGTPRVKWTFISEGKEVEILVARGDRVKVSEGYRLRASLPIFHQRYTNASLLLTELRPNDSGIYRCDVQHGIEDGHDILHLRVKGVVFHYREGSMRYAYTFAEAQEACARIGARIATPEQLYAAYMGGYEQCDAGWIADQTVRYPIHTPREACYGDMNGFPGVRNYGVVDPEDMYDVYCYAEDLPGEIFLETSPERFTLEEAAMHCRGLGAQLASPGQLYAAWSGGLDACSPGWLADGSVRYPIVTPRERCGGALPGVKTIFLFRNQTGFPDAQSRYDAYCFREGTNSFPEAAGKYRAREPEGLQEIVTVAEKLEELQLPKAQVEIESRGAIYAVPFFKDAELEKPSPSPEDAPGPVTRHPPLDTSVSSEEEEEEEEEGAAPGRDKASTLAESGGRDPNQPTEPNGAASAQTLSVAPRAGAEGPTGAPSPAGAAADGHKSRGASTSVPAAEDAELSGDVAESPGVSPLPPAPPQTQEEGEEESGAPWVPSPAVPGDGSTVPAAEVTAVTPWHVEVPGSSSVLRPPGSDSEEEDEEEEEEEEEHPAPSVATVEGFLAAIPGEPGGCVPNPCLNGGTCTEDGAHLACLCLPGYGGSTCERPLEKCSPGWDSFHGACYKHFSTRRSWEDAESQCRHYGGHLATILTPEEQDFINVCWGAPCTPSRLSPPQLYENWHPGQPDSYFLSGENCVVIVWHDGGQWSDVPCNYHLSYTCKMGLVCWGAPCTPSRLSPPQLYENWHPGQPDSYFLSGENCVVIVWHDGGQWSDVPCNYHLSYTCKMGLVQCGPPPAVTNARAFGKPKQRYEIGSITRYQCHRGFAQRRSPVIRCREDGTWEPPQLACRPRLAQPPDD